MSYYDIYDFKAVVKHSFYGSKGQSRDTLICPETGDEVSRWETAANDFLSRYLANVDNFRTLIVAHDMGQDYRSAIFPEYKANRGKRVVGPVEKEQYQKFQQWVKRLLSALGATQIGVEGVEADDVVAWICAGQGVMGVVHTVDADLLQLLSENITVNLKGEHYYSGDTYKDYPTEIKSITSALLGDKSDNYGGIRGFGPAKLKSLYEDIGVEGLKVIESAAEAGDFNLLDSLPDTKEVALIKDNWADLMTMWKLARLHPELCWKPRARKLTKPTIHKRVPNAQRVYDLLREAGAQDLWENNYDRRVPTITGIEGKDWEQLLPKIKEQMLESDMISYDYETTDQNKIEAFQLASTKDFVDVLSQEVTGVSFAFGRNLQNVIYIPVKHRDTDNVPTEEVKGLLVWIRQNGLRLCAHNYSFEGTVNQTNYGIILDDVSDTRIMQRYYDENSPAGLKWMSKNYLDYDQDSYEETLEAAGAQDMEGLTLEQVVKYGADDSLVTGHLYDLMKLLLQLDQQWFHYEKWCIEPTQVLQSAYIKGVKIDWDLQERIQKHDENTVKEGLLELRKVLEDNVSGEVTEGCKSLIEAESNYMRRSLREKHEEGWQEKFNEWKSRLEKACVYSKYEEYEVHSEFKFTVTQLSATINHLGLPPLEKITQKALGEYFDELGVTQMEATEYEGLQAEFIKLLQTAVAERVDKLSKEETFMRRRAFDALAKFCVENPKREPKIVKVGDELNVGSSTQMQQLLYCKLGVPVRLFGKLGVNRTKLGIRQASPSTDEKAIETAIANDTVDGSWQQEALKILLKVKTANTRITLYHNKMPLWEHLDGRVHPIVTDSGTDTRRPTGSAPNILQIPSRGFGIKMRSMYIPPHEDWVAVAVDFSGQELRIMAHESQDPKLLEAYNPAAEKDIHTMTAVGIAIKMAMEDSTLKPLTEFDEYMKARKDEEHPLHDVAESIRGAKAKACNFLMAYGGGYPTLSRNLIITLEEAEMLHSSTLNLYSRIQAWQEETAKFMSQNGFTLTGFGTKRHSPEGLFSSDRGKVSRVHRQLTNATIQGTAAEMLKTILTRLHKEEWIYRLRMEFFAPVYDEVVAFVHKDDVYEYCEVMHTLMSEANPEHYQVPQVPEFSIGADWGRCHELGRRPSKEAVEAAVARALEESKTPVEL